MVKILVERTPNPNALKFMVNSKIKEGKSCEFKEDEDSPSPLVNALLNLEGVVEIYLSDNYLSIMKKELSEWSNMESKIVKIIENNIESHDPNFEKRIETLSKDWDDEKRKEIEKIDLILDHTVRPALNVDGGDLEIIDYAENVLTINYVGACNNCPSAIMGTLRGIEEILRHEYDPKISLKVMNDNGEDNDFFID